MLKIFSQIQPDRDFYIFTKSPPGQFSNSKVKKKEITEKKKTSEENENAIIVFDDVLGSSNSRYVDQFFIRGRHNNLNNFYLSQSYFDLTKRTIRNFSNKIFLFNQTLEDTENIYRDIRGYDMSYDESKHLCKNHGKRIIIIFVLIDLKTETKEDNRFVMKAKTHKSNVLLKRNYFDYHKGCIQLKSEKI